MDSGRAEAILQSDNGPAFRCILQKVVAGVGRLRFPAALQYSSPLMGAVGRFRASLQARIRALLSDMEERCDYKADATLPIT
eukprot:7124977-Alexandrium_andersonii.AAC.1